MNYLATPNSYINVNGQRIAYREAGTPGGTPLVMLVHLAATLDQWDPKLVDLLARHQHVIMLDLPGVGGSEGTVPATLPEAARQAIDIIHALGYQRVNLLGLSMGGMIAQEVVRLDSSLVQRLILVGTAPRGGEGVKQVVGTTFKHLLHSLIRRQDEKRYIFYPVHPESIAREVLGRMNSRDKAYRDQKMELSSFFAQLKAIHLWGKQPQDTLEHITVPTLIVNGDDDRMIPTSNSYTMHEKIKDSKLIIYPSAGHGSLFQYADEFAQAVQEFLS